MSLVPAHWELVSEIRKLRDEIAPHTALVGNGDVQNREHAELLAAEHGIDGVMIGRGVFHDPYAALPKSPWQAKTKAEKLDLYRLHVELFRETWGDDRPMVLLNKFCKTYVNGFGGAKELRASLMHCESIDELLDRIKSDTMLQG